MTATPEIDITKSVRLSKDSVRAWCAAHGFDASDVMEARIIVDGGARQSYTGDFLPIVEFVLFRLRNGYKFIDPPGSGRVATETRVVPLMELLG